MVVAAVLLGVMFASAARSAAPTVNQSGRDVPVAYDVDVVVVGGGTGACAAAIEAANNGASVFLAAPYPYLGDDMTATLRLWLEEGEYPEDPLAVALFDDPNRGTTSLPSDRLTFEYRISEPINPKHGETGQKNRLTDGKTNSASQESLQIDGDATIYADLGEPKDVEKVALLAFHRNRGADTAELIADNFIVEEIQVSTSRDGETWSEPVTVERQPGALQNDGLARFIAPVERNTRYLRVVAKKSDQADRILLGELMVLPPQPGDSKPSEKAAYPPPRPMHIKSVLDDALLQAGVKFLYSTRVTNLLEDAQGQPCGVVMVNRSGRQAVVARTIIDATPRAAVARMSGAEFVPYPTGKQEVEFVVIGGEPKSVEEGSAEIKGTPYQGPWPNRTKTESGEFPIINYTLSVDLPGVSWADWSEVEQAIRMKTFHPHQQFTADALFQVPPDPMVAIARDQSPWNGVAELPVKSFASPIAPNLFVLGGCADISRASAAKLLRPLNLIAMGRRLGEQAVRLAKKRSNQKIQQPHVKVLEKPTEKPAAQGDVGELLVGVRPVQELPVIPDPTRGLPVLGEYEVVVVGAGTSGAPAGIGAARWGAKTLVVEYLHELGGVGTTGAISKFYWGYRDGFSAEVLPDQQSDWIIEHKIHWWRSELEKAGAELWCGVLGVGAFVENRPGNEPDVKGVVVATPNGRGVVLADVVIDCTGNADIAAAAGAETYYTDDDELAMQGTGLPPRMLGASYTNTDFTIVDETDLVDVWHVFVYAKEKYPTAFDQGKLIDTRERQRIVGDFTFTLLDQLNGRTYPDTVVWSRSNFDSHGYTVDPYIELEHPEKVGHFISVPYRSMLPRGFDGILVGGLGMSCHRDAIPMVRMQADLQNQGYALGCAAAIASKDGVEPREIHLEKLQKHLVEMACIPEETLGAKDNYRDALKKLPEAVASLPEDFKGAQIVMWHPKEAHPLVREAFLEAEDLEAKVAYAQVLAVMGDPIGVDILIDKLNSYQEWDNGWNYRGMGQFGSALSPMDRLILALGRAGDRKATPAILDKLKLLTFEHDFSHHRACALALEYLADRRAAPVLAEHLSKPGMTGYVHDTIEKAKRRDQLDPKNTTGEMTRRDSLMELGTARALYHSGDYNDMGRTILRKYTEDLRGHFARHAQAVLEEEPNIETGPQAPQPLH